MDTEFDLSAALRDVRFGFDTKRSGCLQVLCAGDPDDR